MREYKVKARGQNKTYQEFLNTINKAAEIIKNHNALDRYGEDEKHPFSAIASTYVFNYLLKLYKENIDENYKLIRVGRKKDYILTCNYGVYTKIWDFTKCIEDEIEIYVLDDPAPAKVEIKPIGKTEVNFEGFKQEIDKELLLKMQNRFK